MTDEFFDGWREDGEAVYRCRALRIIKICRWISIVGGVFFAGVAALLLLQRAKILPEGVIHFPAGLLAVIWLVYIGLMIVGKKWLEHAKKRGPICRGCGKRMTIKTTIPSVEEAAAKKYLVGESGHSYRSNYVKGGRMYYRIYKEWFVCRACRRYMLLSPAELEPVGGPSAFKAREEKLKGGLQARGND